MAAFFGDGLGHGGALLARPVALSADDAAGCFHSAILACAPDKRCDCAYHVIRHGYRTDTGSATRFRPMFAALMSSISALQVSKISRSALLPAAHAAQVDHGRHVPISPIIAQTTQRGDSIMHAPVSYSRLA
jgi:hypothetical protein